MIGGVYLKKRYEFLVAVILLLFLIIAYFIGNAVVKGILLLLFSAALIFSTAMKLKMKKDDKFKDKFFYGILLFLDILLALGAIFVIVAGFMG